MGEMYKMTQDMTLEGTGTQTFDGREYPGGLCERQNMGFRPETLEVMAYFKNTVKPFTPRDYSPRNVEIRLDKMRWLSNKLSNIYGIEPVKVRVGSMDAVSWKTPQSSVTSYYSRASHTITLNGKFSLITFLHEFGHARGFGERNASYWSTNLFRKVFPRSYSALTNQSGSHVLYQRG